MSYPPLTPAELNKFSEACKYNNMVVFEKYYQKMLRHNLQEREYITAAEDAISYAINYDNKEMFDRLINIGQHGARRYLVTQIIEHAVPHHIWALDKLINSNIVFDDTISDYILEKWVNNKLDMSSHFEWLIAHSSPLAKMQGATLACRTQQWNFVTSLVNNVQDNYLQWRIGLEAAVNKCPIDVLQQILCADNEENSMRLLEERKHVFSPEEYSHVWSLFNQAYSFHQAERIEKELVTPSAPSNNGAIKRKI